MGVHAKSNVITMTRGNADNATAKANIDYIAMMTNVEMPTEGDADNGVVSED